MDNQSIFHSIEQLAKQSNTLPYSFQNTLEAGREDTLYVFFYNEVEESFRENLALKTCKLLENAMKRKHFEEALTLHLIDSPIYFYFETLQERIKIYLSEKLWDEETLFYFGKKLATESVHIAEVKLGIIILSCFENDVSKHILRTLGLHSEFTLYVLHCTKNFKQFNSFAYDFAQHTIGYGKFASVFLLKPITREMQDWLFHFGAYNDVLENYQSKLCLNKIDMQYYYRQLDLNEESFSALSYLLAYAYDYNQLNFNENTLLILTKYIEAAPEFASKFIDLAALIVLKNNILAHKNKTGKVEKAVAEWTDSDFDTVVDVCQSIIKKLKWKHVLSVEMATPVHSNHLILLAIKQLKLKPSFNSYYPMLQKDHFDVDVFKFLLKKDSEYYTKGISNYIKQVIPDLFYQLGPQNIDESDLPSIYKPDICLTLTITAMRETNLYDEEFLLKCLNCRLPVTRLEVLFTLNEQKENWSKNVLPTIEKAIEIEPVDEIKNRLKQLISPTKKKSQKYVDIDNDIIDPSSEDICIAITEIAGTAFHDMFTVEGSLKIGNTVHLIREPDNKYDNKAILVTTNSGYVLGYIPRRINNIPSSILDSGKQLYGILHEINISDNILKIKIMLSQETFPKPKIITVQKNK